MKQQRTNKHQIFAAARAIAYLDKEPTIARVREYLAFTGSQTTLHKYLKEWRFKCFKAYDNNMAQNSAETDIAKLQAENQTLKETISKKEEHSKIVAHEFTLTEKKNIELTQKCAQLDHHLHLVTEELKELKKDKEQIENLYHELKEERGVLLGKIEQDKDQLIASLREELRQTHQTNLEKIQDVNYHGHDLLMQEKVKTINLEEQVKGLTNEVTRQQQELEQAQRAVAPLRGRIAYLEKMVTANIAPEQLQNYAKKLNEQEQVKTEDEDGIPCKS